MGDTLASCASNSSVQVAALAQKGATGTFMFDTPTERDEEVREFIAVELFFIMKAYHFSAVWIRLLVRRACSGTMFPCLRTS